MPSTLMLGDCLERMAEIADGSVDAVVTDPPYGMKWNTDSTRFCGILDGKPYRGERGRSNWGDIQEDAKPFDPSPWLAFPKCIMFGANHYAARLPVGTTLIWLKKADHLFGKFLSDAEIGWMKGGHGVYCFRKQFPPPCRIQEGGIKGHPAHPTQKPVALMRWCIERLKLKPGATILDPYMGSGTTGVAATQLGFNFTGIERDPAYFAIAEKRIRAAENATPLLNQVS